MENIDYYQENLKALVAEKCRLLTLQKELSGKYQQIREDIADLHYQIDKKQFAYVEKPTLYPDMRILEEDVNYARKELDRSIQEKEILNKDLAILQVRLKFLENEIRKTKPWWQQLFTPIQ